MRRTAFLMIVSILLLVPLAHAQDVEAPSGQKTLAASMDVYAFPKEGQSSSQQSKDEAACYSWAESNTGNDPFDLSKQAQAQAGEAAAAQQEVAQAGKGAGAKGAFVGAAGGALIGEIASDDAGKGAAIGAGVGLIAARRARRRAQDQASQQIQAQSAAAQQATAGEIEDFKKAFSVCLEAKNYLVKY